MADKDSKKSVDPITFARQVRAEGEKVTWTSTQETIQATIMVIVMSVIIALFLFLSDLAIGSIVRLITGLGN
ncbi:preprotein translocase subunit SecE [Hyphomonas sp. FCG-A18]|jgi:preprotein translocase subunit SecE|uniref:preprotein translocase subunit SecE n=1 Tax=Hyphomonas sp. FCG-A18 TaxID=3080019 RepID=UPI002B2AD028|nr:preprotein translocase subunit SecE [Hyphomonas sp. FCG-A18]